MSTHDKPAPITIDTKDFRVRISVVNDVAPTGLAAVAYTRSGYDVNVKVVDKNTGEVHNHKRIGSLMWRPSGGCAWSLASSNFWTWANTMSKECGGPFSYRTDAFAVKLHGTAHVEHDLGRRQQAEIARR